MVITTETGSKYHIDFQNRTWAQLEKEPTATLTAVPLRSTSGTFLEAATPKIGKPFIMMCPPFDPTKGNKRLIMTAFVTGIQEDAAA